MPLSLHFQMGKITSKRLYSALHQAIVEHRLRQGEKLPSTRVLARKLGIARNTVISVYERLEFEGLVIQKIGSGTYVSAASHGRKEPFEGKPRDYSLGMFGYNLDDEPTIMAAKHLTYDFTLGIPDHQRIAKHIWRHSRLSRLDTLTPEFAYGGDIQGLACLRESICEYVRHSRGVICEPDDIIITQGGQQALMTTLMTLLSPGDQVAMEDPGYPVFRKQAQLLGAKVGFVPMDGEGVVVNALPSNAKLLYTTPSHQFPLGFGYSMERKQALLKWAETANSLIVEDDYDAEYHYLNTNKQALKAQDSKGSVIFIGSFSKILFTGIRIGYLIPPKPLLEPIKKMLWHLGRSTSVVSQILLDEFMRDGHFSYHLRSMNKLYEEKYHQLTQLIDGVDGFSRIPSQGGLHVAANVTTCAVELSRKLESLDVAVYPAAHFSVENQSNAVLFGFGKISPQSMDKAFSIIRSLVN
ncbi:PLP-dependent aminotransferase family protein [Vibrio sp. Isolate25]|uniref:MocR-like pyridoxine biosynthesis transcription factor PdxR n=1 Tax=Vibrio sp. Isolate25 TaxID=2908535 RepID=UPI001EFC6A82|nr:PLP-dependent aminotransferase family protein [Vibrio sp. Isolate25]MCG9595510.1 PLP-dependent aminotransferase family protein [Vibrio sp. Isolate25]